MKPTSLLAAILLSSASSTLAQVPGSVSNLVISLTTSQSVEGTVQKDPETGKPITGKDDFGAPLGGPAFSNEWTITKNNSEGAPLSELYVSEYVSKIRTEKYGNKELLMDLLDAGLLPAIGDGEPSIAGWAIVEVSGTVEDIDGLPSLVRLPVFYAYHAASGEVVLLSGTILSIDDLVRSGYAENWTQRYTRKNDFLKETESVTFTSTGTTQNLVRLLMDFQGVLDAGDESGSMAQFQGRYSRQEKLTTVVAPDKSKIPVFQCGPGKIENVTGSGPLYGDLEEDRSLIGGQWTTSAGKLFSDISQLFPEAAQDPAL